MSFLKHFLILALVVVGATFVLSCASTNRGDGEQTAEEMLAEEGATAEGEEGSDLAATSEGTSEEGAAPTAEEGALEEGGGAEKTADAAKSEETPAEPNAAVTASNDGATSFDDLGLEAVDAAAAAEASDAAPAPKPKEAKPKARKAARPVVMASAGPRLPKIPAEAVQKKGKNLNRFYFLRKDDTPESVAVLLYGTPSMSKELTTWNGKKWSPGMVLYYVSPTQPEDREMRSFYQERNVPAEEYQLAPGETLKGLAASRYGSEQSWKEIAVNNGITSPDKVGGGVRLALFPASLGQYAYSGETQSNNIAQNTAQPPAGTETPVGAAEGQPPTEAGAPPAQPTDPMMEEANQAPATAPEVKKPAKKSGGLNFGKLIEQNLFAVFIIGAILVLGLLLMVISRRKKSRAADEGMTDEGYSAQRAKR